MGVIEVVSRPHAENLVRWAADRPEVVVLSADLTSSCEADRFRTCYPERFFSLGVAEQNMLGMAGGLAREGFVPYLHTFAVFLTRRALDQIAMAVAYPNLPVRMLGFLPGLTSPGGVTHQAIDDVALMRILPNMTVLVCADATDVESVLEAAHAVEGPVYISMLRGMVPRLFPRHQPLQLGHARVLHRGEQICVLSSGIGTGEAIPAVAALVRRGVSIQHLSISTLKPFDDPVVHRSLRQARSGIVTLENHGVIGGLGSATAELMAELGLGCRLIRLGLRDCYAHGGRLSYLLREYQLDARALVEAVEDLLGTSFDIPAQELTLEYDPRTRPGPPEAS